MSCCESYLVLGGFTMKSGDLVGRVSYYFPLLEDYFNQRPGVIIQARSTVDYNVKPAARFIYYKVLWQDTGYPTYEVGSFVEEHEAEDIELFSITLNNRKKEWYDTEDDREKKVSEE